LTHPSLKIKEALLEALLKLEVLPDLTQEEAEWVRQYLLRAIAEFSALAEHQNAA
jgi:hypothetical protein